MNKSIIKLTKREISSSLGRYLAIFAIIALGAGLFVGLRLSRPDFLEPVPCCSVTRESIRDGFATDRTRAAYQHRALQRVLETHGVTCHLVPAVEGAPDLAFTRDVAVTTPWGLVALNPALSLVPPTVNAPGSGGAGVVVSGARGRRSAPVGCRIRIAVTVVAR